MPHAKNGRRPAGQVPLEPPPSWRPLSAPLQPFRIRINLTASLASNGSASSFLERFSLRENPVCIHALFASAHFAPFLLATFNRSHSQSNFLMSTNMLAFEEPSPATSSATTRTNRGGRPKEWTEPRARRLTRLYCFTSLKVDQILDILRDDVWVPGKEAANKHLNQLLGKDPRWIRPRDVNEQRQRIAGLKKSERAKKYTTSYRPPNQPSPLSMGGPEDSSYPGFPRVDTLDGTTVARSSGSSLERTDIFMTGQTPVASFPHDNNGSVSLLNAPDFMSLNNRSSSTLSRFIPGIRSRQGTSLTTSTDFSVGSSQEAYHSYRRRLGSVEGFGSSDIKDIFRLLKRFTISNDSDAEHSDRSPITPSRPQSKLPGLGFDDHDKKPTVKHSGIATYTVPGDFIYSEHSLYDSGLGRDQFGNTTFHLLAAAETCQPDLVQLVSNSINNHNAQMTATNTGKQTFLHVLHDSWFRDGSLLDELLDKLRATDFDFYATDVYGRTFFHLVRQKVDDVVRIRDITRHFNLNLLNRRDAFGVRPMIRRAMTIPNAKDEGPSRLTIPITGRDQERIREHTQLLKVINESYMSPNRQGTEDNQGRNALHCLSEVVLGMASIGAHANGTRAPKRKLNENDEPIQVCPLSHRLQYLECLLEADVDVNHYNANGDTVLMAFISHIEDGQDDKDLESLVKRLLAAGANIEARNRNGETVLHVAARLGQKFAVKVLLEQGANIHVRNCDNRSVLQTTDDLIQLSEEYPDHNARLEATRGVLTGRYSKSKAEQNPTVLQEWAIC